MLWSNILDVGIGVTFLFLVLSLVCSAINELIESALKNRARDLESGLRELLCDPQGAGIVMALYRHPLVNGLFRGAFPPKSKRDLPSYIPSRTFALALMDVLQPAAAGAPSGAAGATVPASQPPGPAPVAQFRATVAALPASAARTAILSLIDAAGNDAARARQNIEDWYDAAMDRVSGWYKRRTQLIVFGLGLVLAALANADVIAFTEYLSTNKEARDIVVANAQAAIAAHPSQTPAAAPASEMPPHSAPPQLVDALGWLTSEAAFPFGWRSVPHEPYPWFLKILGIVLTGCAVSFGAPFWFDVLNKFMVVRSTVKPQEKSAQEGSKS